MTRLKVLISAYACSPFKGSEPGVGWGFVAELAKHHELWVMVEEEKFRKDIERYLAENPQFAQSVHFYYLRKQRNRWLRKLWPPSYYWYYRRWHQEALELARRLHKEVKFDLAHQLTMVGFREPGYLWQLGIPFVWGPIGGMGYFPWRFLPAVGWRGGLYYLGYNLYNAWQMRFTARPQLAAKAAGRGLIAATPVEKMGSVAYWGGASILICEVGLPPMTVVAPLRRKQGENLRIVWSGQHTPGKALNLALDALPKLADSVDYSLHVLGKGVQTSAWQILAEKLGVSGRCHFHGWLARDEAMQVMANAHVMLITSLRDLTSTVAIEALALGLPIVCLDHCGFGGVVDESCGIKVPVTTPREVIHGLAAALNRLDADEPLRYELAAGAVQRAQDYSWAKKISTLNQIYMTKVQE